MPKKTDVYYWIDPKRNFGRFIEFGDEIKDLDPERAEQLLSDNKISRSKPESITSAQLNSLEELKEENKALKEKISELETQLEQATEPKE